MTGKVGGGNFPGDITAQPAPSNIWGEPLTEDERSLIVAVIDAGEPQQIVRWLNHVLKCYDGQAAELAAARAETERLREALREIATVDKDEWHYDSGWKCVRFIQGKASTALAEAAPEETP